MQRCLPGLYPQQPRGQQAAEGSIYRVSKTKYSIGPYEEPKAAENSSPAVSLDETLHTMQALGVDLKIIDK